MINDLLPFPEHKTYVEVFGGSAVILLNKIPSQMEYFNDINSRLVNAWQVLQQDYHWFKIRSELDIESRQLFEEYKLGDPHDLEDAYRFFYVNRHSFSGNNKDFTGIRPNPHSAGIAVMRNIIQNELPKIHTRIKNVVFEKQDYQVFLKRFLRVDSPDLLLFIDPPYQSGGHIYEQCLGGKEWTQEDFDILRVLLTKFKHAKVILTLDIPEYLPWISHQITKLNKVQRNPNSSTRTEFIYYNYDPSNTRLMSNTHHQKLDFFIKT